MNSVRRRRKRALRLETAAQQGFGQGVQIIGRGVYEIDLANTQHEIDLGVRRQRAADVEGGGADDAQPFARAPSAGGQTA